MSAVGVRDDDPIQLFRQVVAAIILLAYCLPIIGWTIYGISQVNWVSWRLEDPDILSAVTSAAENSTSVLNLLRQILLPLIAAFTASILTRNIHTAVLFGILVVTSALALIASLAGIFVFGPSDWEHAAVNRAFFSDLASSLAVYVMLLVGLKI